jgi:hypothetical protein
VLPTIYSLLDDSSLWGKRIVRDSLAAIRRKPTAEQGTV